MRRALHRSILAAIGVATALGLTLGGCSAAPLSDQMPESFGGLPAGAPARPVTPYQYPAVHDIPPPRSTSPMTEDEQMRLEKDLQAARDRQEGRQGPVKKAAPPVKKQPAAANNGHAAGAKNSDAKTSGAKTNP
jgi:hypothetical protein